MTELKSCFIELGCAEVFTYLNRGNMHLTPNQIEMVSDMIEVMVEHISKE